MTRSRSIRAADRRGVGFGQLRRFLNECASMGDGARVTVRLYLRGTIREVTVEADGDSEEQEEPGRVVTYPTPTLAQK